METWQAKAFKLNRFDAIIKLGGSIVAGDNADAVASVLCAQGVTKRFLILPGGGDIDNLIEEKNCRKTLERSIFHRATALAQDQTGLLFTNFDRRLRAVETIKEAEETVNTGLIPVLLPSRLLFTLDVFRYTNRVSSDTLSAYIACLLHVPELIVLKSRKLSVFPVSFESLAEDTDFVDEIFPEFLAQSNLRCLFVSTHELNELAKYLGGDECVQIAKLN
jgi:aspartokinase-like uncharacterized kinase